MNWNLILNSIAVALLSGCAVQKPIQEPFIPATEVIERPAVYKTPAEADNVHLRLGNDPALERAFHQYMKTGKAPNIMTDGFVKYAYNSAQQPIVKTTPFQETVISLQPGERFTSISSGDPSRWSYSVAVSGSGAHQQQNVLVKPSAPNISTNMIITTDRRIYNLGLVSADEQSITKNISFWYPEEMLGHVNEANLKHENTEKVADVPDINIHSMNFSYSITCGVFCQNPDWKPTRVFDDGTHTYIQFPHSISSQDMPALFVLTGHSKELVNYRFKAPYFIVDKIFNKATLVLGVGNNKRTVDITNNSKRG